MYALGLQPRSPPLSQWIMLPRWSKPIPLMTMTATTTPIAIFYFFDISHLL